MAEGQTLQALIAAKKGRRTYDQLAVEAGGIPATSRWQQMAIGAIKSSPDPAAVRGIARALRVDEATVWDAIGVTLGLDLSRQEARTLQELIAAKKGRRTYEELAAATGNVPSVSRWQQFGADNIKASPAPDAIAGMAVALRVPVAIVWEAIGRSLGLDLEREESNLIAQLPPGTSHLSARRVQIILDLIDELMALTALEAATRDGKAGTEEEAENVRPLRRAARKTTGHESRGKSGQR